MLTESWSPAWYQVQRKSSHRGREQTRGAHEDPAVKKQVQSSTRSETLLFQRDAPSARARTSTHARMRDSEGHTPACHSRPRGVGLGQWGQKEGLSVFI